MKYEWKFPLQGNEDNVLWDLWITPFRNAKKILKVIIKFRFKGARGGGMVKAWEFPFILLFSTLTSSLCVRDWRWDQTRALTTGSTPTVGSSRMRILGLWSRANVLFIMYTLYTVHILYILYTL